MTETVAHGTDPIVLSDSINEYQHDRDQMVFKNCCVLVLWTKVASGYLVFQCLSYFRPKHMDAKIFENHLNPVMLVFIV